jgi:uncharacterized membrane protein
MPEQKTQFGPEHHSQRKTTADQRMERRMGLLLRTGVMAAAFTVALGGIVYLAGHGRDSMSYSVFRAMPLSVDHPRILVEQIRASQAEPVLDIGILLLIATPVMRVFLGLFSFARERDWMYVVVSALVLGALLFGSFHGI